jgi:DNA mismatch repair protein MutS2
MAFDPATLAPLYRLEIGLPGTSNALHVARVMGLSGALVERARSLLGKRDSVVEDMIDSIQLTRMAAEEDRKRSEQTVRELAGARDQLRAEQEELELRRAWLREEADHLVDEELKAARSLLAIPLREFRNAPQPYGEKARDLIEALDFILGRSPLARRRLKYIGTLKKGDIVYVPRYRRRCVVQKVDRTRERILVAMGDLRAEIAYEEVSWLQPLAE